MDNTYVDDLASNTLDPYTASDANIEYVQDKRTCIVLAPYVPLVLAESMIPCQAWEVI